MTKFCVFWRTWNALANFSYFFSELNAVFSIQQGIVFTSIDKLNGSSQTRDSFLIDVVLVVAVVIAYVLSFAHSIHPPALTRASNNQSETWHVTLQSYVITIGFFGSNISNTFRAGEELNSRRRDACLLKLQIYCRLSRFCCAESCLTYKISYISPAVTDQIYIFVWQINKLN